ncbi:MAG: AraC family transcriptional regulator [Romboutsia sp.]
MFIKITDHTFKNYGDLIYEDLNFNNSYKLNFKNKKVLDLKLVSNDNVYIKVTSGVAMILVSNDGIDIKSYIINRPLKLKKGIYFNLVSVYDEAEVTLLSDIDKLDSIKLEDDFIYSAISPLLSINEIYTKFYQEKGARYNFPGESHPYWELTYVDIGILSTSVDGEEFELKQGDLIFYAPNQFHKQSTLENNSSSYLTLNFNMNFSYEELLANKIFTLKRDTHSIVTKLIHELSSDNIYSSDLSLCYLKELIIQTLRSENSYFQSKPATYMQQSYENSLLDEILKYIKTNVDEKLTVESLCKQFCMSSSTLHSLFKKNLDITVKNHINELKLDKSKELIKNSTYTISEISEILGFSSIHYFSKKFKSSFGISPTEYSKSIYQ